jgi:hypothetical protein
MKKKEGCLVCGMKHDYSYECDICGEKLIGIPITVLFGYGNILDGEEYHFCSEGHAIRFLADELRKQQSENINE